MLITLSIGILVILFGAFISIIDNRAKKWKQTIGVITQSELKESISFDSDNGISIIYRVNFEYTYMPDDKKEKIIGKQLFPYVNVWSTCKREHLLILDKLKNGTKIKVYYNPNNLSQSCLLVGQNYQVRFLVSIGLAFIVFAIVFWIYKIGEDYTFVIDQFIAN